MTKVELNRRYGYVDTDNVKEYINNLENRLDFYEELVRQYEKTIGVLTKKYRDLQEDNKILLEENDRMNKILYKIDDLLYNECNE